MPGAICSWISGLLLLYYIALNITLFFANFGWISSEIYEPISHTDPEQYSIERDLLAVATKLVSDDASIPQSDLDSYVQGVYAQVSVDLATDVPNYTYIQAVDCLELYPDIPESFSKSLTGYLCPNVAQINLQGNLSQEGPNTVQQFQYIVNSCDSMAPIRV